jgi:hypothetical protein
MRRILIAILTACLTVLAGVGLASKHSPEAQAAAAQQPEMTLTNAVVQMPEPMPKLDPMDPVDPHQAALMDYFETAMQFWLKPTSLSTDYHSVASDVAQVVLSEEPIWPTDTTRGRTGIQMLAIAFHESSFRAYVDNGTCNRYAKDEHAPKEISKLFQMFGDCDGGMAHSMWQVWPKAEFSAQTLDADRKNAIRAALYLARRSIRGSGGLCWYSGEGTGGDCPKAAVRYETAQDYWKKHPFHE